MALSPAPTPTIIPWHKRSDRTGNKGKDFDLPWTPAWWGVTDGFVAPVNTGGRRQLAFDDQQLVVGI